MSSVLGQLVIELTASTNQFQKSMRDAHALSLTTSAGIVDGLKNVETQLSRLKFGSTAEWQKSGAIITASLAGLGVAAAGAAFVFAKSTASEALELNKLAQTYGISIEALSGLQVASKMTGVSMESMAKGLGFLDKAAVAAVQGHKQQILAFQQLGIATKDLTDGKGGMRDQLGLLLMVADRFSKLKDHVLQVAEAKALMGRGGPEELALFNQGAAAIQGYIDKAKELGFVLTAEDIAAALKFHEEMVTVEVKVDAARRQIAIGLIPALNAVGEAFTGASNHGEGFRAIGENIGGVLTRMSAGFRSLAYDAEYVNIWLKDWAPINDKLRQTAELQARVAAEAKKMDEVLWGSTQHGAGGSWGPQKGEDKPVIPSGTAKPPKPQDFASLFNEATAIFDKNDPLQKQIDKLQELRLKMVQFEGDHPHAIFLNLNDAINKADVALANLAVDKKWAVLTEELKAGQKQIADLFSIPMAVPMASGAAKAASDEMQRLKDSNYIMEERGRIFEATRTPMERYALDLQHINSLYADKSSDEYNRAVTDLDEKLREQYDPTIRLKKALDDIALAYSLGAMNADAMARAVAKVNADIAMANTVTHPMPGMAGVRQGLGAGAGSVATQWQGMPAETASAMIEAAHGMQSAMSSAFSAMIMGTKTVGQAFAEMGRGMLESVVNACMQMLTQWIITHVLMAAIAKAFGSGTGPTQAGSQIAGNAAIAASDAAVAAGNTLALMSAYTPPPGPEIAAGLVYAEGMAFAGMASMSQGGLLPRDMMVQAHAGEAVLPERLTSFLRASADRAGGTDKKSGGHTFNMPITINGATDPEEVANRTVAKVQRLFKTGGVRR